MREILYFLVAIFATTVGALTGMGGGVIIKPVLDILGHYDVGSISMLSSITVFFMALVSVARHRGDIHKRDAAIVIPLALGSVLGGNLGTTALKAMTASVPNNRVTLIQNVILALLVGVIFVYMKRRESLPTLHLQGVLPGAGMGLVLGMLASFLGIGGGPFNVALIMFAFSVSTKSAAVYSLVTILFSQGSKLITTTFSGGFGKYDLIMLLPMVIGAVSGGFIGAHIHRRISERTADRLFLLAQALVLVMCGVNILRSL